MQIIKFIQVRNPVYLEILIIYSVLLNERIFPTKKACHASIIVFNCCSCFLCEFHVIHVNFTWRWMENMLNEFHELHMVGWIDSSDQDGQLYSINIFFSPIIIIWFFPFSYAKYTIIDEKCLSNTNFSHLLQVCFLYKKSVNEFYLYVMYYNVFQNVKSYKIVHGFTQKARWCLINVR